MGDGSSIAMSGVNTVNLQSISCELLRLIARWLNPKDRLNFAICSQHTYRETWGNFAVEELSNRFPLEHRLEIRLNVTFNRKRYRHQSHASEDELPVVREIGQAEAAPVEKLLRIVPERSRMQHCYVAVASDGTHVAVLAYDSYLRLISMRTKQLIATVDIGYICGVDVWDMTRGKPSMQRETQTPTSTYEEENGIDVEVGFGFSQDNSLIFVSGRSSVQLYRVSQNVSTSNRIVDADMRGNRSLYQAHTFHLSDALQFIGVDTGVGGSCALSPDNKTVAWVVFSGSPAKAYVTVWDVATGLCMKAREMATVQPRRWSALGWARVAFWPNGRYLICIANSAKKATRVVRVGESFQHLKLSEFEFTAFDMGAEGRNHEGGKTFEPTLSRKAWLEISSDVFSKDMCSFLSALVDDIAEIKASRAASTRITMEQEMRLPGLLFNFMHSCPSEATYKDMFAQKPSRRPWFVTKQPMYSLRMSQCGARVLVATAPHANEIYTMVRNMEVDTDEQETRRRMVPLAHGGRLLHAQAPDGVTARGIAFRRMPWRAGFATASAFSTTGKWLASATLIDDRCVVCCRNLTLTEALGS
jgi:hypothetical protein